MFQPAWNQSSMLTGRLSDYANGYIGERGTCCCCPSSFDGKDREIQILMDANMMLHSSPCCSPTEATAIACCGVRTNCCCGSF